MKVEDTFKKENMRNGLYIEGPESYTGIHLSPYSHDIVARGINKFLTIKGIGAVTNKNSLVSQFKNQ